MARLSQEPITPRRSAFNPDSRADLDRLLARLQQNILHADAEREQRLRMSEQERNKAGINLEYARALLTKLEQDAPAIKVHALRQEMQLDLNQKREILEQLTERLRELGEISIDSDEDDSDDGEDLLSDVIPTPSQSSGSRSGEHVRDDIGDPEDDDEGNSAILPELRRAEPPSHQIPATTTTPTPLESHSNPSQPQITSTAATTTSTILRQRGSAAIPQPAATDTATTSSALRSQLLGSAATSTAPTTTTATAEAILDHHRAEQDKLTESMVSMAKTLKASTHAFSSALHEDQDVLAGAGKGLDRSERGLETVAGRMGNLRRLTEGKGWWGRMMLYAWIAGLAVLAVLLVFVFPKLRF